MSRSVASRSKLVYTTAAARLFSVCKQFIRVDQVWGEKVCNKRYSHKIMYDTRAFPLQCDSVLFLSCVYLKVLTNVINLVDKFRATECTERKKSVRWPTKVTEDAVEDAKERMQRGRNKSVKKLAVEIGVSYGSAHKILRNKLDRSTGGPPKLLALSTGLRGLYSYDDE
ncbi:hypothetical protein ANN_06951 [Periplaneta americana]|uniref:Uncharacterized protein n=1 Tax=Periplaneta americana TaxID=6978 RepID=A0ABQ8TF18_PERAM|nr:hypothetical protein ANN_06951 [Periplaneta americana]